MKKIIEMSLLVCGIIFIVGCVNNAGKDAYSDFKERYAFNVSGVDEVDKYPVSIYKVRGVYYAKVMKDNKYTHYYSWEIGTAISEGRQYETEKQFNEAVENKKPIYEQNMK